MKTAYTPQIAFMMMQVQALHPHTDYIQNILKAIQSPVWSKMAHQSHHPKETTIQTVLVQNNTPITQ